MAEKDITDLTKEQLLDRLANLDKRDVPLGLKIIRELGSRGDQQAVESLGVLALDCDAHIHLREAAIAALGRIGRPSLDALFNILDNTWPYFRNRAASALGKIHDERSLERMLSLLADDDWKVRKTAAHSLGRMRDPQAVAPLIDALTDENLSVRLVAMDALETIGTREARQAVEKHKPKLRSQEALDKLLNREYGGPYGLEYFVKSITPSEIPELVNGLIEAAYDPDYGDHLDQELIALALGYVGKPAVRPLVEALSQEPQNKSEEWGRYALGEGLAHIADPSAIDGLIGLLSSPHWNDRGWAIDGLLWIADPRAFRGLIDGEVLTKSDFRNAADNVLSKIGTLDTVPRLITVLLDGTEQVHQTAAVALEQFRSPHAAKQHVDALNTLDVQDVPHSDMIQEQIRAAAAKRLGEMGDVQAVEPLIKVMSSLTSDERDLLIAAAEALGNLGDASAVDALAQLLATNNDPEVERVVLLALGQLGDHNAIKSVISMLSSELDDLRVWAAKSLGQIGDPASVESLKEAFQDENATVRQYIIEALNIIAPEELTNLRRKVRKNQDPFLAIGIPDALPIIFDLEVGDLTSEQQKAIAALMKDATYKSEPFVSRLGHKSYFVREKAIYNIGYSNFSDALAVDAVIASLSDSHWRVRKASALVLGHFKVARAIDSLTSLLSDDIADVQWAAAQALKAIGTPEALKALEAFDS